MKKIWNLLLLVVILGVTAAAEGREIALKSWLVIGPLENSGSSPSGALAYDWLDACSLQPSMGDQVLGLDGRRLVWNRVEELSWSVTATVQVFYGTLYLETKRWLKPRLTVSTQVKAAVYLDGVPVVTSDRDNVWDLSLDTGKHRLLVKWVVPAHTPSSRLQLALAQSDPYFSDSIRVSLDNSRAITLPDLLNLPVISSLQISPDGGKAAVIYSRFLPQEKRTVRWLEIFSIREGRTLFATAAGESPEGFAWTVDSHGFTFTRSKEEKTWICEHRLGTAETRTLTKPLERFAGYQWSPDGRFLVYSQRHSDNSKTPAYRYIQEIPERSLTRSYTYSFTGFIPSSGLYWPLATETENLSAVDISPDGKKLLFTRSVEDTDNRPYSRNEFILMAIENGEKEVLIQDHWAGSPTWSPDGRQLLFIGSAAAFSPSRQSIRNDYDLDLFLFDLAEKKADNLTARFSPSVESAIWNPGDGRIYLKVVEGDGHGLYRFSLANRSWQKISTPVEVISHLSVSERRGAVLAGSSPNQPPRIYSLDLRSGEIRPCGAPPVDFPPSVRFGKTERVSIPIPGIGTIGGSLYYPVDFQPGKVYPCIVNFYGGTTPVMREFGGRYPKEWYAANGYFVLVLQPSGAIGLGPEKSVVHVNDWGEKTSEEILAAVSAFLSTRPFIDGGRMGAIGASYGGFLSQYLATQTDRFAAFISHAGISSLASYWGVGDWGYSYSAVASANSFPWNRKDLYVGHSPLFMAERIKRPLLLLHGESDNNVPPGESYQMYAALKLLGKEVALVTFPGQFHFVLDRDSRERWMRTIIAWFDRWLKGEPQYWEELYGKEKPAPKQ